MAESAYAILDLLSIAGWIFIGISGLILRDILQDAKSEKRRLSWQVMYFILPLLLFYPSILFYQYLFGGGVMLSKRIISILIAFLAVGAFLLLYLAHQVRALQLKRELSSAAGGVLVIYIVLSVYLSFQLTDYGDMLNNLLFSTAMMMLSLAMFYLASYTLPFARIVRIAPLLYAAGILILLPGIVSAFEMENRLLSLYPHPLFLKAIGTLGILLGGMLMFIAADKFKRKVLEFGGPSN
ncbi:MAG TPA: hypothetical protein VJI13_02395 [Candidatus Norongarragalinales archaeon]|nr:hypothetical protein [Candidatus Norongarragalinales archaeon]